MELIVENVKIDKTMFVETYTHEEWLQLFQVCHSHYQEDRKEFMCVYCHYKKNSKMKINENQKKGCNKVVDSKKNPFKLKLYPPLKNAMEGVHLAKGENIIKHR